jgi:hypothetical protein
MLVKKHFSGKKLVLAVCDSNIIGKKFVGGKRILDLSSEFYKGEEMAEEDLLALTKRCYIINAVGKDTIKFLIKNKLIEQSAVLKISNMPYTQICVGIC